MENNEIINKILQKAGNVSTVYSNALIKIEHIFFSILSINDYALNEIFYNKGIDCDIIGSYIESNQVSEFTAENVRLDEEAVNLLRNATKIAKEVNLELSPNHILLAMFTDDCYCDLIEFLENTFSNFNHIDIYNEIVDYLNNNITMSLPKEMLDFGYDLTEKRRTKKCRQIIGRENDIDRVIQVLCRKTKANPIIIGEAGVGKSTIVEGLAQRIVDGKVPQMLENKIIFYVDIASVLQDTKYRGELEKKLKLFLQTCEKFKNIILFIDEIHSLINASNTESGEISPANIFKPFLANGELSVIGATTTSEYKVSIEKDKALTRRFQSVEVLPPTKEETTKILFGLKEEYENFHNIKILDEAIYKAVSLADKYIKDRNFPDKAIDLIEDACSNYQVYIGSKEENRRKLEKLYKKYEAEKYQFDNAEKLENIEKDILEIKEKLQVNDEINADMIEKNVAQKLGIPIEKFKINNNDRLKNIEEDMAKSIIGHEDIISKISGSIRSNKLGYRDSKKPIGSYLLLGPSGVGKTLLAKSLAKTVFESERNLIKLDMTSYSESSAVSKIIGAAPGYAGYDAGSFLVNKIRKTPYSVLLLDEVEKAHDDVLNLFLQVMDSGTLKDNMGEEADFSNVIIIMTSNQGIDDNLRNLKKEELLKLIDSGDYEKILLRGLNSKFRTEFLNRIDSIAYFKPYTDVKEIAKIIKLMLNNVKKSAKERNINFSITKNLVLFLIDKVKNGNLLEGMRPIERIVQHEILDKIANEFNFNEGTIDLICTIEDEKITFKKI